MNDTGRYIIITIAIMFTLTLASLVAPVSAVNPTITENRYVQELLPDGNNRTYVYYDGLPTRSDSRTYLSVADGVSYWRYWYGATSWSYSGSGLTFPAERHFIWQGGNSITQGPLGRSFNLPSFYDFYGGSGEPVAMNSSVVQRSFGLNLGQHKTVVMEQGYTYFGVLTLGNEEFVHLTVASRQDSVSWSASIVDPQERQMGSTSGSGGDVAVIPFMPSGGGTYVVKFTVSPSTTGPVVMDVLPEAISPRWIAHGEVVQGVLSESEWAIKDGSNVVHSEKAPTVHTYKFRSPIDQLAKMAFSFNQPEFSISPVGVQAMISSGAFEAVSQRLQRFSRTYTSNGDTFYYQSGRDETYYISVIGSGNGEYTLFHELLDSANLPVNEDFYLENTNAYTEKRGYNLFLEQDGILRVNHTWSSGVTWHCWSVTEEMLYVDHNPVSSGQFQNSAFYYLPAGHYVVEATLSSGANGKYEFNVGAISDDSSVDAVSSNSAGYRVPASAPDYFNLTISLMTQDNITVTTQYRLFDVFGNTLSSGTTVQGNIQSGGSWIANPINQTFLSPFITSYTDIIIALSPIEVLNNTAGPGNEYINYTVNYELEWLKDNSWHYEGIGQIALSETGGFHSFTLPDPGSASETYRLELTGPIGVWWNVTVNVTDVSSHTFSARQLFHNVTQYLPWGSLSDTFSGSTSGFMSLQFGTISNHTVLSFSVNRALVAEGFLYVEFHPLATNEYVGAESLIGRPLGPLDFLAQNPLIIVGAGAVIVVIAGVVFYRRRTAL
ncbi:MAG: hypothetical protein AM324_000010 [Candidatus Thorarchaeota archaeon SMTZ1-83]|nr:MAG: hypothetical protein AM324_00615 [Candidatus Thorarchaeota archaeon SMTZ1-83]